MAPRVFPQASHSGRLSRGLDPACSNHVAVVNEVLPEVQRYSSELSGKSVDGVWCHLAFARERKPSIPLLPEFRAKGEVTRMYGCASSSAISRSP